MSEIKTWFEEADSKVFTATDHRFIIVGGFKVTHYFENDSYSIQDTRVNDFYTRVLEADMKIFREHGFKKGTSIIMHKRNVKRVEKYLKLIQGLYTKRVGYMKNLKKTDKLSIKRIKNCNYNIHNYHDLMHFYKSKVEQFESKQLNN